MKKSVKMKNDRQKCTKVSQEALQQQIVGSDSTYQLFHLCVKESRPCVKFKVIERQLVVFGRESTSCKPGSG